MKLFDERKPFFKGNLHTHTTGSDGRLSPEDACEQYRRAGYDFLAITDHWKVTVEEETMHDGMLVMPGIELDYTLAAQVIHTTGLGVVPELLERVKRHQGPQKGIDEIVACGGLAVLAHPAWSFNTHDTIAALRNLTAAEIYNTVSGPPWNGDRADATAILDMAAANGTILNTIAADDAHFYDGDQTSSYIWLQTDRLTMSSVLCALSAGAYYSSRGPRFEQIEIEDGRLRVTCSPVKRVLFHSDIYYHPNRCVDGDGITEAEYEILPERRERFVRVILVDEFGARAWANPVRLQP